MKTGPVCVFVLWYRAGHRQKWERVGSAPTEAAALALMRTCGRRGGDWMTLPVSDTRFAEPSAGPGRKA